VVYVDPVGVDPECGEAIPLGSEVLIGRGDPSVAILSAVTPSSVPYAAGELY